MRCGLSDVGGKDRQMGWDAVCRISDGIECGMGCAMECGMGCGIWDKFRCGMGCRIRDRVRLRCEKLV